MKKQFIISAMIIMVFIINSCRKEERYLATLTTKTVSEIWITSASSGGEVLNDGGYPIISRGICWNSSTEPTILNNNAIDSSSTGQFVIKMTQLASNTKFYVRAFAMNEIGIAYGNEESFTTLTLLPPEESNSITAYWNMDNLAGNVLIDYKNLSNGLITNCQGGIGKINDCLNFNGVSSYVRIKDSNLLDSTPEFSLLVWINAYKPLSHAIIYSNLQEISPHDGFSLSMMKYGRGSGNLQTLDRNVRFFSQETDLYSKSKITYGEWTHIAITYKNNVGRIFINGKLDNEGYLNTPLANEIDQCIGASYTPYYFFKGLIDELKILNIALEAPDILNVYNKENK